MTEWGFLCRKQFKFHRSIILIYPHFQPTHEFISITVNSVLLVTLCLCIQLNERIHDWHSNTTAFLDLNLLHNAPANYVTVLFLNVLPK
jgi:hypothetical protein